jgi:deazaflavin-dependent oxidoreductase (nitroreductase family)
VEKLQTRAFRQVTKLHVAALRFSGGRLGATIRGAPVLILHHRGRRSGDERVCPLLYLPDGERMVIVASKGGSHRHPAWFLNLREMDETEVEVGGETQRVSVRIATAEEREGLWPRVVEIWPDYAAYQRRTEREIPLIVLDPLDAG